MVDKKLDLNSNYKENKAIKIGIWVFTIVVFALVGVMGRLPKPEVAPSFTKALPAVNAIINVTCFLCLVTSFIMIKKKNITMHMRLNTFAMILSVFFLLSYVLYHLTNHYHYLLLKVMNRILCLLFLLFPQTYLQFFDDPTKFLVVGNSFQKFYFQVPELLHYKH